jgi:8-oxo-dGTP pyrophosphatase MutT (NUDIX family)
VRIVTYRAIVFIALPPSRGCEDSIISAVLAALGQQKVWMANSIKARRKAKEGKPIRQVAAIPCRVDAEGKVQVMLITSRTTKRFIVPKGWPMKGKSRRKTATIEAREEAGVTGRTLKEPAGIYSYWKRTKDCFVRVEVTVFLLPVAEVLPKWNEARRRRRAWMAPSQAALLIDEPELATLIAKLGEAEGNPLL